MTETLPGLYKLPDLLNTLSGEITQENMKRGIIPPRDNQFISLSSLNNHFTEIKVFSMKSFGNVSAHKSISFFQQKSCLISLKVFFRVPEALCGHRPTGQMEMIYIGRVGGK